MYLPGRALKTLASNSGLTSIVHFQYVLFFLISILVVACQPTNPESISVEDIDFGTTDDSELFFKNVRQSYYDKEEIEAAGMDVFRMSDRNLTASYPLIHLAIAYNWRNDQAFLMVEPNEYITDPQEFKLLSIDPTGNDTTAIDYAMGNMKDQVAFAHQLFLAVTGDAQLYFDVNDEAISVFDKFEDREVIRKTVLDYYKLIGLIR